MRPLSRLRWQLTLSHLKATTFTLVSMTAAIVLIGTGWFHAQEDPRLAPAREARLGAEAVSEAVARGDPSGRLDMLLAALVSGELRVAAEAGPPWAGDGRRRGFDFGALNFRDVAYLAVVGPDGRLLGSSDPSGTRLDPPERAEWAPLVTLALSGERDPARLSLERSGPGPLALGAYPVFDGRERPIAAVVVARTSLPAAQPFGGLWRAFAVVAASLAVLLAASLFALVSSSVVAYLLARRLVGRLERLGGAAEALAGGDLSRRVDEGEPDEVGQLARRFNRMADRLASTVAQLESALKTKRELVANVSHELRTPLASIRGHTESLLMQDEDAEARRAYLEVIHGETEQLGRLVDDLFTFSTAEARALPLELEPVALGEVIEEVASSVRPAARRERRVAVAASVAPDLPPALADRRRVVQVLANLVRNALRHTPEGGLVALRAERRDGWAALVVEDTGDGIPPERLPHVFERFYRGDEARDRASSGAGLGLAIVRELVEAMGGEVGVESSLGQGSRFWVRLPLAAMAT